METVPGSVKLEYLETLLYGRLQSQCPSAIPLQISCFSQRNNLIILVHYLPEEAPEPQEIFPLFRQTIKAEGTFQPEQIQLYLIVHGQSYQLEGSENLGLVELESEVKLEVRTLTGSEEKEAVSKPWFFSHLSFRYFLEKLQKYQINFKQQKSALIIAVTTLSTVILSASLYALTRPCVLGKCQAIVQARQLAVDARTFLQTASSETDLVTAKQQLGKSIEILQTIPWWSISHAEAAILIQDYQLKFQDLDAIFVAKRIGSQAVILAKSPPLSIAQWQEIRQLWQEGIANLKKVHSDSNLSALAQTKLQEYQRNLAYINQRLSAEQKAVSSLKSAEQAAKLARVRENNAQSLSDWQLVYASWQTGIKRLKEVSPGTTVYEEAKQLLEIYLPKLVKAGTRQQQEEFATKIYQQARGEAKLAEEAQSKNQWTAAVSHWRNALTQMEQIPKNSFQSHQAQPLISTYALSLKQAETKLKAAIEAQKNKTELEKICSNSTKICSYLIGDNVIKVTLTSSYIQHLWNTALEARSRANFPAQVQILSHISQLEQSLQKISNRSGKRVEVYNSDGNLMVVYEAQISR